VNGILTKKYKMKEDRDNWEAGDRPTLDMNKEEMQLATRLFLEKRQRNLKELIENEFQRWEKELEQLGLAFSVERL
jgi:hypothetical protein